MQSNDEIGILKSNVKGWHSKDFDLKAKEPQNFISIIQPNIKNAIDDMNWDKNNQIIKITNMWAIINKGGAANLRHHHGNSTLSAHTM